MKVNESFTDRHGRSCLVFSGVKKFSDALAANTEEFTDLWNADATDCEYTMVKQDERLKEICGPYWVRYEERYPLKVSEMRRKWETG